MNSLSEEYVGEQLRENLTFYLYEKIENNLFKQKVLNYISENISEPVYLIAEKNVLYSVIDKACGYKFTQK
jgi:hypothetical protein